MEWNPPMHPAFDYEEAMAQVGGSDELLAELVEVFRGEYPPLLDEMEQAIARQQAAALLQAAHTLKGSAQVLGAGPAAEAALRLEQMGRNDQLSGATQAYETLRVEIAHLLLALEEWRQGDSTSAS
jgi:two-component system, sensor histidine kinase and response regulator